jgi:hydrogenase maturation factor
MCLAVPAKIIRIDESRQATARYMGDLPPTLYQP